MKKLFLIPMAVCWLYFYSMVVVLFLILLAILGSVTVLNLLVFFEGDPTSLVYKSKASCCVATALTSYSRLSFLFARYFSYFAS